MTWGKYYWPFFLIVTSLLFLGPEIIALVTNSANTLSEYSWAELNVNPHVHMHTIAWWASLTGFALAVIVLSGHIWFKQFP